MSQANAHPTRRWLYAALGVGAAAVIVLAAVLTSVVLRWWRPVGESDLPGTYSADYAFATETVTLKPDGQFVQDVKMKAGGRVVVSKGKWRFDPGTSYVTFDEEFMVLVDGLGKAVPDFDSPTRKNGLSILPVGRGFGSPRIGSDESRFYKKQAD